MDKQTSIVRNNGHVYLTVFIANLPYFAVGHAAGWSSPSLPIITSDDFYLKVTADQVYWITSLMSLGGFFGPFVSGPLLDVVGRKWTITVNMAVVLTAWIVMACAWSVEMLYIGRFMCGLTTGVTFTTVPIYIAEISEPSIRGLFNNLPVVTRCLTILFQYSVGPFVSYLTLIQLSCIMPVLYFILVAWMPETPYFLVAKGKKEDAEKSLTWLRGEIHQDVLKKEIADIQSYIDKSKSQKGSYKDLFNKKYRRIICITFVTLLFSQLVGTTMILFYLEPIFQLTGSTLSSSLSSILVGLSMSLVSFLVPIVAKKCGYKKPMVASSFGLCICMVVLGGSFFFRMKGINSPVLDYIPVISLVSYIVILSLGMLNLPWALAGEILPSSMKAQATAVSGSFTFLTGFVSCITFPIIENSVGLDFGFWLYACFCFSSAVFIYTFVPETRGLTLSEIQDVIKLPHKNGGEEDRHVKGIEIVTISYLKNRYEINSGTEGRYTSKDTI